MQDAISTVHMCINDVSSAKNFIEKKLIEIKNDKNQN